SGSDVEARPSAVGSLQRILHDEGEGMGEDVASDWQEEDEQQSQTRSITEAAPSRQLQEAEIARLLAEVRRERCSLLLERRLTESILPEVARARVRASFAGRVFEDAE